MCIVAGPEIVRAPVVVKVPDTLGKFVKSNTAVMVTGTGVGVEADTEGTEPIAKQPSTSRIVVNVMFRFFIFNFLLLFWPSLISRYGKSFLAVHPCTAGNPARGYAEKVKKMLNR